MILLDLNLHSYETPDNTRHRYWWSDRKTLTQLRQAFNVLQSITKDAVHGLRTTSSATVLIGTRGVFVYMHRSVEGGGEKAGRANELGGAGETDALTWKFRNIFHKQASRSQCDNLQENKTGDCKKDAEVSKFNGSPETDDLQRRNEVKEDAVLCWSVAFGEGYPRHRGLAVIVDLTPDSNNEDKNRGWAIGPGIVVLGNQSEPM